MRWAALFALAAIPALSQDSPFRTRSREVVVPVSVTTKNGKPVESLTAADFLVLNDGEPRTVRMISQEGEALPVYAVLVLQTDDGSEAALSKIKKTASVVSTYITNNIGTGVPSLAAIVTVSDDVSVAQDFTSDPDLLHDAFRKLTAKGGSGRLLDGVSLACDMFASKPQAARRVIVLIGESRDRQSRARFPDIVRKAQGTDIVIYTISYSAYATAFTQKASDVPPPPDEPGLYDPAAAGSIPLLAIPLELARLAKLNIAEALPKATGGLHEKFTTLRGLETQLIAAGTEIHNRYTLTFVPPEPQPPGYHRLDVNVRKSGDWRIHARAGYWSAQE